MFGKSLNRFDFHLVAITGSKYRHCSSCCSEWPTSHDYTFHLEFQNVFCNEPLDMHLFSRLFFDIIRGFQGLQDNILRKQKMVKQLPQQSGQFGQILLLQLESRTADILQCCRTKAFLLQLKHAVRHCAQFLAATEKSDRIIVHSNCNMA